MISILQAIIGDAISLAAVVAILAGIIKLFQIATSLTEIRDLLVQIKRNTQDYSPAGHSEFRPAESLHLDSGNRADASTFHSALVNPEP